MNVGFMKETQIQLDTQLEKIKHRYEGIQENLREQRDRIILDFKKWRDRSEDMLTGFTKKFKRGPLSVCLLFSFSNSRRLKNLSKKPTEGK
jgi:hypothetical protein